MTANTTQHGYLLLADLSGYTSFVAATELEHAQDILSELLELIVGRFKTLLTIHKLEGDAVFAYAPEEKITRGESILDLIETIYLAFRARRDAVHRRTTCTCNACRNIPNLDLKFITHYGDYFVQDVMGTKELVGSDVNVIHRLLKNHINETRGWHAYALFSAQSLDRLQIHPDGLHEQIETYEHLGDVRTLTLDLGARYQEIMQARNVLIPRDEAHSIFEYDYNASAAVLWEWFNDPHKRRQWMSSEIVPVLRIGGRNGPGARNHCVHGKDQVVIEDVLDSRPYEYFTVSHTPRGNSASLLMTYYFQASGDNTTHLTLVFKGRFPHMPDWFNRQFCRLVIHKQIIRQWKLDSINELIAKS